MPLGGVIRREEIRAVIRFLYIPKDPRATVRRALHLLDRTSEDWQGNGTVDVGSLHWPVAVNLARRELANECRQLTGKAAFGGKQMPVSTLLPPELVREVKRLCGITHAPMAAYVREGLEMVLEKRAETLRRYGTIGAERVSKGRL